MVTTVCFVDDVNKAFEEAYRVLLNGGSLLVGLVDRQSPLGKFYSSRQKENVFCRDATFFSVDKIVAAMKRRAYGKFAFRETVFEMLSDVKEHEPVKFGYGKRAFVVILGEKASDPYSPKGVYRI